MTEKGDRNSVATSLIYNITKPAATDTYLVTLQKSFEFTYFPAAGETIKLMVQCQTQTQAQTFLKTVSPTSKRTEMANQ